MPRNVIVWWLLLCLAALSSGCNRALDAPQTGVYRAVLELPGGEAPFGLEVRNEDGAYVLYLLNGAERTRVPRVTIANSELTAVFPGYENTLRARMHRRSLEGTVTLIKAGGKEQVIPFQATLGESHWFFKESATDNADVAGRWEVTFTDEHGETSKGVAILEQQHDRVTGTVMTPSGDHRFLAGQVRDDELMLSTFAGGLAYLYKLDVERGGLAGRYWQGLASTAAVSARRNEDATLDGAGPVSELKPQARFDFTFPDLEGKPVSLSDARFRGKVVVVTLGGSWCPNCHDEAMFLVPFHDEYQDRGVEIVALMFERHGEFEKAVRAVRSYREDLGIEFPTLIAGVSDTDDASKKLPSLTGVYGYPTTLFIDKRGRVRKIHTGFSGPATGKHYDEYVAEFRALVDALLAEDGADSDTGAEPDEGPEGSGV